MDLLFWKFTKEVGGVGVKKGTRKITFTLGSGHLKEGESYLLLKWRSKNIIKILNDFLFTRELI